MSESLGKTFKKIRKSKHLTIEEVSERTRIPRKIISIIEMDSLHEISSAFYARGFVKSYSQFLGATEEKPVKEYLSTSQKKDTPQLVLRGEKIPGDWFIKHRKHIGATILAIFGIYLLVFGFVQTRKFVRNTYAKYRVRFVEKQKSKKIAVKLALPKATKPRAKSAATPTKKENVEIKITARNNTWVHVVSDGTLLFRGVLKKGSSDIWRAKEKIRLELGNAGGVTLSLSGKNLGTPGKKGEKKTILITEDGIIN